MSVPRHAKDIGTDAAQFAHAADARLAQKRTANESRTERIAAEAGAGAERTKGLASTETIEVDAAEWGRRETPQQDTRREQRCEMQCGSKNR